MQTVDVRHYSRDGKEEIWKEVLYLREDGSVRMMEKSEGDRTVVSGWSARTEWTRGGKGSGNFYLRSCGRNQGESPFPWLGSGGGGVLPPMTGRGFSSHRN